MLFCTKNAASKSITSSFVIFLYEKLKNYSMQFFKESLFFVFGLFCFLLLSDNILHLMFYTFICCWNTFQYQYILQITFHVEKQYHVRVTSKEKKRRFSVISIYLAWMNFSVGPFAPKENWQIFTIHKVKSMWKFLHVLKKHFLTFLLFVFIEK